MLLQENMRLPTKISTPLTTSYRPELDASSLLNALQHNLYQQFIGILRWAVELGRRDIHLPVALMAQYLTQPQIGHLQKIFHIFAYIKAHPSSRILLDDTIPYIQHDRFIPADWRNFYQDAKEAKPRNAPEP
jgi:hypothetical protein